MEDREKRVPTLQELYPKLSENELKVLTETLYRYCEIVLRIADRLLREEKGKAFDVDCGPA